MINPLGIAEAPEVENGQEVEKGPPTQRPLDYQPMRWGQTVASLGDLHSVVTGGTVAWAAHVAWAAQVARDVAAARVELGWEPGPFDPQVADVGGRAIHAAQPREDEHYLLTLDALPPAASTEAASAVVEDEDVGALFESLAAEWIRATRFFSSTSQIFSHPMYHQILGLGAPAIPHLLRRLRQEPWRWVYALSVVTREDPVPPDADEQGAVAAWQGWGRSRGYPS